MLLIYIGMYLLTGVITMTVVVCSHLYKAEKDGYEAMKWWEENRTTFLGEPTGSGFIWGLVIWPKRVYTAVTKIIPTAMKQFESKH